MQLGFVSAILPELSLKQVLQHAARIGYDCVEVMCWPKGKAKRRYAGVTHIDVANLDKKQIKKIATLVKQTGVQISALGYYPNPLVASLTESAFYVEHILKIIEAAPLLGLDTINTFVGRDQNKTIEENWDRFVKVWTPIVKAAEKRKVKIGIENCPMSFTKSEWPGGQNLAISPAVWTKMFEAILSDYFGLNYDPSHMVLQQMDHIAPIRDFSSKFFHVHAKDLKIDQYQLDQVGVFAHPNLWHTPKLPGLGQVNWSAFFSTLSDKGYNGAVCVEVEDRAYEGPIESRLAALEQSYRYLRQYM